MHLPKRVVSISILSFAAFFSLYACESEYRSNNGPNVPFEDSKIAVSPIRPTPTNPSGQVQDYFHMEEKVIEPIEVPEEVLLSLQAGEIKMVDACMLNEKVRKECYEAGRADLNGDDLTDFVVIGRGKMLGANITPFWVFLGSKSGSRLVLETAAHDLMIGTEKRKGLFDISTVSMTAVEIISSQFSFNGNHYEFIKTVREKIN